MQENILLTIEGSMTTKIRCNGKNSYALCSICNNWLELPKNEKGDIRLNYFIDSMDWLCNSCLGIKN